MKNGAYLTLQKWAPLLILLLWGIYLIPLFVHVFYAKPAVHEVLAENPEGIHTFLKSHVIAFITSILNCAFGLLVASFLIQRKSNQTLFFLSSLLLLPIFIGDSSSCLIWRIFFMGKELVYMNPGYAYGGYGLMSLWESGTFFAYLIWIGFLNAKQKKSGFLQSANTLHRERLKLVYLPATRITVTVLFVFSYCKSLWIDYKFFFVFRSSRGLDTESVGQWINRIYKSASLISPARADTLMGKLSFYSYWLDAVIIVVVGFLVYFSIKLCSITRVKSSLPGLINRRSASTSHVLARGSTVFVLSALMLLIFGPIVYASASYSSCSVNPPTNILGTFGLTILASFFLFFFVVSTATYARIKWGTSLNEFTPVSILLILGLASVYLIPHEGLVQSAFHWFATIGYGHKIVLGIIWILVHIFQTGPLLLTFCIVSYFSVNQNKLNYLHVMRASSLEIFRVYFLGEYKLLYFLIFLIGFINIWNDSTVNIVMSDYIPSFAVELKNTTVGPAANYANAMTYVNLSIIMGVITVVVWNFFIKKMIQSDQNEQR